MTEPRLITPDMVEQSCIACLGADARFNHRLHLAKLERQIGLPARTIESFKTVDLLVDEQAYSYDITPAALLAVTPGGEIEEQTEPDGSVTLSIRWTMDLWVFSPPGGGPSPEAARADAMQRARWLTMTAVECLVTRASQIDDVIDDVQMVTVPGFENFGDSPYLARGEAQLSVLVRDAMTLHGAPLRVDPADPYAVPGGPFTATDLSVDTQILTTP